MADPTTSTPVPAAVPPPAVPAPAAVPGGVDLSALAQPAQPSITGIKEYQDASQAENTALQGAKNAANISTAPPPPGPHARLVGMIQGLALGLDAAGKSIATRGKEGGVEEVQQVQAQKQQQQIQAQQARDAQKNQQIQQQLMVADTNHKLAQNVLLMATLPNTLAESDLNVAKGKQEVQSGAVALQNARNESIQQWGVDPLAAPGPAGQTQNVAGATKTTQQLINFASDPRVLGPDNPAVKTATDALAAAQKSGDVNAIIGATAGLRRAITYNQQAIDSGIKQQTQAESAPFGPKADTLNAALLQRYQVLNPSAKALPSGYALTANSTKNDFDRVDRIMQQSENAQATKANRDVVNGMREEMMNLAKGADVPGDTSKSGDEYVASLPVGVAGTIKAIHEGREAPPPAGSRSAAAQTILGALNHAYPEYDATKYSSYLDARKKFTTGPEGKGINALNTVETHLARMYDHATKPGTSGGLTGAVTGFFGDKDVRALDIDRTAVSTELSKAYAAGQISEGEVKDWESKLDFTTPGMTTGKLITNLKEIDGLLEGKQRAYEQQWSVASPAANIVSPVPVISPDAAAARAKIRGESSQAGAAAPEGHQVNLQGGGTATKKGGKWINDATGQEVK